MHQHLTPKKLSQRWSISEGTLCRWRKNGLGPAFIKLNRSVIYRLQDVEIYENESLYESTHVKRANSGGAR